MLREIYISYKMRDKMNQILLPQILHETNLVSMEIHHNYHKLNHSHKELEIIYVMRGNIYITLVNDIQKMSEGNIFLLNSNEFHSIESVENSIIVIIHINYLLLTTLLNCKSLIFQRELLRDGDIRKKILSNIEELLYSYFHVNEEYKDLKIQEKTYKLCFELMAILKNHESYSLNCSQLNVEGQNERLSDILLYLQVNYAEKISLEEVATMFSLSVPYLSKFFKKKMGETFLQYLNKIRTEHAISDLLYTQKSLTKIAYDNGFSNLPSFNRIFYELYKQKPLEYKDTAVYANNEGSLNNGISDYQKELIILEIEKFSERYLMSVR